MTNIQKQIFESARMNSERSNWPRQQSPKPLRRNA
jgi:hypothetical protein